MAKRYFADAEKIERLRTDLTNEKGAHDITLVEVVRLRTALQDIAAMKAEDLYYAKGQLHDNAAAAYAAQALAQRAQNAENVVADLRAEIERLRLQCSQWEITVNQKDAEIERLRTEIKRLEKLGWPQGFSHR